MAISLAHIALILPEGIIVNFFLPNVHDGADSTKLSFIAIRDLLLFSTDVANFVYGMVLLRSAQKNSGSVTDVDAVTVAEESVAPNVTPIAVWRMHAVRVLVIAIPVWGFYKLFCSFS
jgi:hypothetical protein